MATKPSTSPTEKPTHKQYSATQPSYRLGVLYQAGDVVTVPADEKPSKTWVPIEEEGKAAPAPAPTLEEKKGARANDVSPV